MVNIPAKYQNVSIVIVNMFAQTTVLVFELQGGKWKTFCCAKEHNYHKVSKFKNSSKHQHRALGHLRIWGFTGHHNKLRKKCVFL